MRRLKIVADEKIPFLHGVLEPFADIAYLPGNQIVTENIREADALLIRTRTICDKSLLEGTSVKFIATATIGFDHIDTVYCQLKNISWRNAPGCNSSSVQQYVCSVLLMLAIERKVDLNEKTLGIIGVGNVGSKVREIAGILGMKVKLNDPPRAWKEGNAGFVGVNEILETCDIITLHVPLNMEGEDKTYHFFDEQVFGKMKNGAWLINTSRGEVVDTNSLKAALSSGRLKGAVMDVWENEPTIDLNLLRQVSLSTPHIAGYSIDGKANGTSQVVRMLSEFYSLPLLDFYPRPLPAPPFPEIVVDVTGKSTLQAIYQAVLHTYPIWNDHNNLQQSTGTFEQQRGNYPVRREFPAYTVRLLNGNPETAGKLIQLGFTVKAEQPDCF